MYVVVNYACYTFDNHINYKHAADDRDVRVYDVAKMHINLFLFINVFHCTKNNQLMIYPKSTLIDCSMIAMITNIRSISKMHILLVRLKKENKIYIWCQNVNFLIFQSPSLFARCRTFSRKYYMEMVIHPYDIV